MKSKLAVLASGALVAGLVSACGGGGSGGTTTPTPPPSSNNLALDTAGVLALAVERSESTSPLAVNAGALTLTDTSDSSEPINVAPM